MSDTIVDPQKFLERAMECAGLPYIIGAKGPLAFDCSGLVTYCIWKAGGPDWRKTHNAQSLADALRTVHRPEPKQILLAIYGFDEDHIDHVMILTPDGRVFGSCGGDHNCKTVEKAKELGACVQYRSKPDYRHMPKSTPLVGFRALELKDVKPTQRSA